VGAAGGWEEGEEGAAAMVIIGRGCPERIFTLRAERGWALRIIVPGPGGSPLRAEASVGFSPRISPQGAAAAW
jgi:hypothetical protein